jgi:plasmid stability protein
MPHGMTLQLDDWTVQRLRERAREEGLSVEEEARRLLHRALRAWEPFWAKADGIRDSLVGQAFDDSSDLIREDRDR